MSAAATISEAVYARSGARRVRDDRAIV